MCTMKHPGEGPRKSDVAFVRPGGNEPAAYAVVDVPVTGGASLALHGDIHVSGTPL